MVVDSSEFRVERDEWTKSKIKRRTLSWRTRDWQTVLAMFFQTHTSPAKDVFVCNDVVINMVIIRPKPSVRQISRSFVWIWIGCLTGQIQILESRPNMLQLPSKSLTDQTRVISYVKKMNVVLFDDTAHAFFCSRRIVFSSVQKDDQMSKRLAEFSTESATARQTPAHNLCVHNRCSIEFVIKLCSSHVKNLAEKNLEQDSNRDDSHNHMEHKQSSGKGEFLLSGTERSVALKHEESRDLTLIHKPHDAMIELLKTQVLHKQQPKIRCFFAAHVPSQPSSLVNIHGFVYVGNSEFQKKRRWHQTRHPEHGSTEDSDDLRNSASADQQLDKSRSRNPRTRRTGGLDKRTAENIFVVGWPNCCSILMKSVCIQCFGSVLWRKTSLTFWGSQNVGKRLHQRILSKRKKIDHVTTSDGNLWNSCGRITWVNPRLKSSNPSTICWTKKDNTRLSFRTGSFSCLCTNGIENRKTK